MRARSSVGRDLGAEASAERLSVGAPAEVVIPARAGWLGDELELACARLEFDHGLVEAAEVERLAVDAARVEVFERASRRIEVLLAHRGGDVDPVGQLAGAVHDAGEGADHDEADVAALKRSEQLVGANTEWPGLPRSSPQLPARARFGPSSASSHSTRSLGVASRASRSSSSLLLSIGSSVNGRSKPQAWRIAMRLSTGGEITPCSQRAMTTARGRSASRARSG